MTKQSFQIKDFCEQGRGSTRRWRLALALPVLLGGLVCPTFKTPKAQAETLVYKAAAPRGSARETQTIKVRGDFRSDGQVGDFVFSGRTRGVQGLAMGSGYPDGPAVDLKIVTGDNEVGEPGAMSLEATDACGTQAFQAKTPRSLLLRASRPGRTRTPSPVFRSNPGVAWSAAPRPERPGSTANGSTT